MKKLQTVVILRQSAKYVLITVSKESILATLRGLNMFLLKDYVPHLFNDGLNVIHSHDTDKEPSIGDLNGFLNSIQRKEILHAASDQTLLDTMVDNFCGIELDATTRSFKFYLHSKNPVEVFSMEKWKDKSPYGWQKIMDEINKTLKRDKTVTFFDLNN